MYSDSAFTLNEQSENDLYSGEEYEDNIDCEEYADFVSKDDSIDCARIERDIQMYETMGKISWDLEQMENPKTIKKPQLMSRLEGVFDDHAPSISDNCLDTIYGFFFNCLIYMPTAVLMSIILIYITSVNTI
jgi:hypothetical protein